MEFFFFIKRMKFRLNKQSVLFLILFCCVSLNAQTTVTLSIVEATTAGCGDVTDCDNMTVCYNVYGTPSSGLVGYTIVGYNIWISTTNGSSTAPVTLPIVGNVTGGSTSTSCSAYNSLNDVLGNTGNIYSQGVTNDQGTGGVPPIVFVAGPNLLFNFCVTYSSLIELEAATLLVGSDIVGITSELVSKLGGSVILNTDITPGVLALDDTNTSCLATCDITAITTSSISPCNNSGTPSLASDDTFTANVTVTFDQSAIPATGTLDLTGDGTASVAVGSLSGGSYTFTGVVFSADGSAINLTATFSAEISCTFTNTNAGTAPVSCSAVDPCDSILSGNPDNDGDGVSDICDLDDDNDGILDVDECTFTLTNLVGGEFGGTFGTLASGVRDLQTPITVDYSYATGLTGSGKYNVVSQNGSNAIHPASTLWNILYGHTTGLADDAYLAVNGNANLGIFYKETFNLDTGSDYELSVWGIHAQIVNTISLNGPAEIGVNIYRTSDNVLVGQATTGLMYANVIPVADPQELHPNDWTEAVASFNTGGDTSFRLEVVNISGGISGNDFAIDDISLTKFICTNNTDGVGKIDKFDLDSDGDGCSDADEAYADTDADGGDTGIFGTDTPTLSNGLVNNNGLVISAGTIDVGAAGAQDDIAYSTTPAKTAGGQYAFQQAVTLAATTPASDEVCVDRTTSFSSTVTVIASPTTTPLTVIGDVPVVAPETTTDQITYVWQVSIDGGTVYNDIPAAGTAPIYSSFSGTATTGDVVTLGLSAIPLSADTYLYRVRALHEANICGVESLPATLTVNALPEAGANPANVTCFSSDTATMAATAIATGGTWTLGTSSGTATITTPTSETTTVTGFSVAGSYILIWTDDTTGCTDTATITVGSACACTDPPTLVLTTSTGTTCADTVITVSNNTFGGLASQVTLAISANGAGSLDITTATSSPFNFTYTPVAADAGKTITITVTTDVTDTQGGLCVVASATYAITVNDLPTAAAGTDAIIDCTNTSATIGTASVAGLTYAWLPTTGLDDATLAQPTATPAVTTTYSLVVTETLTGCVSAADTVLVTVDSGLPTAAAGTDAIIDCTNTSATIGTASVAGLTYAWLPTTGLDDATLAQPTATPAVTTTYSLVVTETLTGCVSAADTVLVTVDSGLPTAVAGTDAIIDCTNTSATIGTASVAGLTYAWLPTTGLDDATLAQPTATPAVTTTYSLVVTETLTGCVSVADTVLVTVDSGLPTAVAGTDAIIDCTNTSATIGTASVAGLTYAWLPTTGLDDATLAQPTATPAVTTTYSLVVTETLTGCVSAADTVLVTVDSGLPTAAAGTDAIIDCTNTSATIGTASVAGLTYAWLPTTGLDDATLAQPTATPAVTTTYSLVVTETLTGCVSAADTVLVTVDSGLPTAVAGTDAIIDCTNTSATIGTHQ